MIKESTPIFALNADTGADNPERLERPGQMGQALLDCVFSEWKDDMLSTLAKVREYISEGDLDRKDIKGMLKNWDDFGKYLLTLHNSSQPLIFDMDRFGTSEDTVKALRHAAL